jgi:arginine/lysine/ornithine decarboxylase
MASGCYALAMTSVMDTQEGFDRLTCALHEIDATLTATAPAQPLTPRDIYRAPKKCMELHEAEESPHAALPLSEAAGHISAAYISLYPPGIPIIVPGEALDAKTVAAIMQCIRLGLQVEGLDERTIQTVVSR